MCFPGPFAEPSILYFLRKTQEIRNRESTSFKCQINDNQAQYPFLQKKLSFHERGCRYGRHQVWC